MKITIKTTPDSLTLELTEVTGEALTDLLQPARNAILKHPDYNPTKQPIDHPETGTLEKEIHSFEDFEAFAEKLFEAIEKEVEIIS